MAWLPLSSLHVILAHFVMISVLQFAGSENVTDIMALLDFKNRITDDPLKIMASWNDSTDYCNWKGITCDPFNKRVSILNLRSQKLIGSLPPSMGNLSYLTVLNLIGNGFHGEIPEEIGLISGLKHLNLTFNMFNGLIPPNLSGCTELTFLALEGNMLSGQIPSQLSSLSKLQYLGLMSNNLTGGFPAWIGNFSSQFSGVTLALNNLQGRIPPEIGRLSGLKLFQVYGNQFSGELPSSIYNISPMSYFSVTENRLHGEIPPDIGLRFPSLEIFAGGVNNFTGRIPVSLSNASRLELVDFAENSLTGTVPSVLGSLPFMYRINFDDNHLGYAETGDMNFVSFLTNCTNLEVLGLADNFFGGQLPGSVANLSTKLKILTLGGNQMHGNLPLGMEKLENLTLLGLEGNYFTGSIPYEMGKLQKLGRLYLTGNKLTGKIPISLGNLTSLSVLHLDSNNLQGRLPSELGNCTSLLDLNLSSNNLIGTIPKEVMSLSSLSIFLGMAQNLLSGPMPIEVSKLTNLEKMDVSENKLSGGIPFSLSECTSMEILLMGSNLLQGTIPDSLEALRGLREIDFSHNNLSGKIPVFFEKLPFVRKLDLSYNDFEGEVPINGIFSNTRIVSVVGNKQLCGGAPSLQLPQCSRSIKKSDKNLNLKLIIPLTVSLAVTLVLICSLSLCYMGRKPKNQLRAAPSLNNLQFISYHELYRSTSGFSAENIIGSGSFGTVYRGILGEDGSQVAVKVLNLEQKGATKSFMDECAVLKSTRHRNLLKTISVCSSIDHQGNQFRCLVSELMANGSLDEWLHPIENNGKPSLFKTLNIVDRLNIVIDVASAIDYLHNHCHNPIVHCDLKPSNVLLDEDFTAHVADFGLSKFLQQASKRPLSNHSSSVELKGSIGYIPPEYGASAQVSTLGDVYSYGILILELFTGKRPTDEMFNNGQSIHRYVDMAMPEHVMKVLDPSLIMAEEGDIANKNVTLETKDLLAESNTGYRHWDSNKVDCLVSIMKIGVPCSMSSPEDRMPITSALNQLHAIRNLRVRGERKSLELSPHQKSVESG